MSIDPHSGSAGESTDYTDAGEIPPGWAIEHAMNAGVVTLRLKDHTGTDREVGFLPATTTETHPREAATDIAALPAELREGARAMMARHRARLATLASHRASLDDAFPDLPELLRRLELGVGGCRTEVKVDPDKADYVLVLDAEPAAAGHLLTLVHRWLATSGLSPVPTPTGVTLDLDAHSRRLTLTLDRVEMVMFACWLRTQPDLP